MGKSFEGVEIIFADEFELTISPSMKKISLDEYNIESIKLKYENRLCGCCEGSHCEHIIKPADLLDFISAGGSEGIEEQKKLIKYLQRDGKKLQRENKKYKNIIKTIKEVKE